MRTCGRVGLVCFLALALYAQNILAADSVSATTTFVGFMQVLLGLGLVLAAIAATAWLLKRLGPGQVSASGSLRVVGGVAIGPKERVVLVDVGDTRLVLGVSPGHVSTLHQMPRPLDEAAPPIEPIVSIFQDKLKALLYKNGSGKDVG
jgi:flagellar protein FliO/FliZ